MKAWQQISAELSRCAARDSTRSPVSHPALYNNVRIHLLRIRISPRRVGTAHNGNLQEADGAGSVLELDRANKTPQDIRAPRPKKLNCQGRATPSRAGTIETEPAAKLPERSLSASVTAAIRTERRHVNHEPVSHVALDYAIIGLIHLLDRDHFDIGR